MIYSHPNLWVGKLSPLFLWAEDMNTAVHVINRTGPTKHKHTTLYEL